ncbi:MAG: flagellar basal-body MS-ring/collar protein FliF [Balneolaceae bacterium]
MARFFTNFKNFFQPLNGAQRTLFVLFSVGLLLMISLMFYWILRPNYTLLFGSLSPESAQEIVEELQSTGIDYELDDSGRSIRVPRDRVYDLRLKFAADGVTGSDYQGYELFDQNSLGMTDFMQRLNQKRALEGELSRTISNLSQVEASRIHIVLPDRSPFQETTVEPSASVILNLKRGQKLDKGQIEGIGSLIAGSVEGLAVENVVILDQLGNRISENVLVSEDAYASSAQMKVRKDMEAYLTEKAQTMLDRVLGPGNSIVRVSTEHNFDRIVRESNLIDPESRIIISEERRTSTNTDQNREAVSNDGQIDPFVTNTREDESSVQVRNYEVNKTHEQQENVVGEITRISASLLLNYKSEAVDADGENAAEAVETQETPYTAEEIEDIRNTLKGALGIVEERGDEVAVTQIRFKDPYVIDTGPDIWGPLMPASEIIRYVFLAVGMIVFSWLIYRLSKNFSIDYDPLIADPQNTGERLEGMADRNYLDRKSSEDEDEDLYGQKLSEDARRKLNSEKKRSEEITKFINDNTHEAAALVRTMINQPSV